ncbi:WecB/TagA/CpsF family glycosyltransferase [Butyrivibrio sp. AE3009]|uniref:WecB/TagA/CpsF family glycosyltransferase n=1 Tax=Butyrivibrio sp. AE3009 TaxID=1280666 RepID=UPI0003B31829|nr:WecB/TagA/CpsF family glycosyltransferase [Butyrivibrio sp. AE3009]
MNNSSKVAYPKRRVFIIDELALILAFFTALVIRYRSNVVNWKQFYDGLYISFLVVLFLLQIIIFLLYDLRKKSMYLMDPVENFFTVAKGKILLIALGLLYLYSVQRGTESSRFVVAAIPLIDIVYDFIFRMLLKKQYFAKATTEEKCRTYHVFRPYPSVEDITSAFAKGDYDELLIHDADSDNEEAAEQIIAAAEAAGIRAYVNMNTLGYSVRSGIATDIDDYAAIPVSVRKEKFNLFGIEYSIARCEEAVLHVMRHIKELSGEYICFSNVHTCVMGKDDPEYRQVLNDAAFVFPDGAPIAKLQQRKGYIGAERVAGPDFMEHIFRDSCDGKITHYFYGASENTIEELKKSLAEKYPGMVVKGYYSPPFKPLTKEEDEEDVRRINESGADIVWIGLGAPKQEKWMKAHRGRVNGVMMGVGAGFDFHAGTIKRAPVFVRKIGLEWLYRLFQDPKRLIGRYFVTNLKFICYLTIDRIFHRG